jgi:hypothetical protein
MRLVLSMNILIKLMSVVALVLAHSSGSVIDSEDAIRAPDELHAVCAAWYIPVPIMAGLSHRQRHAKPSVPRTRPTLAALEKVRQRDRMSA